MPEHQSWFSVMLGTFWSNLEITLRAVNGGAPVTQYGHTTLAIEHVVSFAFVAVVLTLVSFRVKGRIKDVADPEVLKPDGTLTLRNFAELLTGAILNMMLGLMTKKQARYFLPLIGTCAFLIFFSNVMGLIPGFLPPTSNLNTTVACALVIFFATHIYGVKEHGLPYFKHFFGPIWWLAWLIFPIELIGHIVRPVTLSVRLMANMTADHLVLAIFLGLVPFLVPVPMYFMGCIVVTVQTLVFCLLSAIYIGMAVAHEGH
jgi:F-type H+-transporting ATPase subunit a